MKSKGDFVNLAPYLKKLSTILRIFNTTNIITIKLINPLYLCVGDSPERIETCLTLLGVKERQLLYFLTVQEDVIYWIHFSVDSMVTIGIYLWVCLLPWPPWWLWLFWCYWLIYWCVSLQELSLSKITLQGAR